MKPDQPTVVHVHNTNYASATATASAAAGPPVPRKSIAVAYLALGWMAGVHRFYLRKYPVRWTAFFWISGATVAVITPVAVRTRPPTSARSRSR